MEIDATTVESNLCIFFRGVRDKAAEIQYRRKGLIGSMNPARLAVLRRNEILRSGLHVPDPESRSRGSFPDLALRGFPVDESGFAFID